MPLKPLKLLTLTLGIYSKNSIDAETIHPGLWSWILSFVTSNGSVSRVENCNRHLTNG